MRYLGSMLVMLLVGMVGCGGDAAPSKPPPPTPSPLQRVSVIETEQFVTFYSTRRTNDTDQETIELVQKAAEQWMGERPELVTSDISTSQHGHSTFTFCITLHVLQK